MASPAGPAERSAIAVPARPYPFTFHPERTALVVIDMQRDFLEPGGFGEMLGNDVGLLGRVVEPLAALLGACRGAGLLVIHTREGHRPDLADCPPSKLARGGEVMIGTEGPKGRILVRGEEGHDIVDELAPIDGEVVLDKPGKGAFYATDLELLLRNRGIESLIVTGVTTEVCVHTTVREANDRGFECCVPADCVGSYFPEFHEVGLKMIAAQGGIFGWVGTSTDLLAVLGAAPAAALPSAI
jgi:nicotinamidase-related amidase